MDSTSIGCSLATETVSTSFLADAMRYMAAAAMITDTSGHIVWVNDAMCRLAGYEAGEMCGRTPAMLQSGNFDADFYRNLWETISAGSAWRACVTDKRKDGSLFTASEIITPLTDRISGQHYYIAILQDISDVERGHEHERYLAYHDSLTGLANRSMFLEVASKALAVAARTSQIAAVMFIDLDGFKSVNDRLGHHIGDMMLMEVAKRLLGAVRQADTVARLGGDEFAILALHLPDKEAAEKLARKLLDRMNRPCMLLRQRVALRASIGIAFFPEHGFGIETLLAQADGAMYQAKRAGGKRALTTRR